MTWKAEEGLLTEENLRELMKSVRPKKTDNIKVMAGIGFCEQFVERHGTTLFIMAVQDGSLIPAGEAMDYYADVMSGKVPFSAGKPPMYDVEPEVKLPPVNKKFRGSNNTPKKKKRK